MFCNDKFPVFEHPYKSFKYFQNKGIDSNNTLNTEYKKRQNTNGFIKEQPFLSKGSKILYSSHWGKKKGTSMWNAWVLWVFVLLHASNFTMETEDNSIPR